MGSQDLSAGLSSSGLTPTKGQSRQRKLSFAPMCLPRTGGMVALDLGIIEDETADGKVSSVIRICKKGDSRAFKAIQFSTPDAGRNEGVQRNPQNKAYSGNLSLRVPGDPGKPAIDCKMTFAVGNESSSVSCSQ
jgi:hypothetical protein